MRKFLVVTAWVLALSILLCSCAGSPGAGDSVQDKNVDLGSYPLNTDVELTYWVALNANVAATATNMGETAFAKELEKKTGVKIKYIHPAMGQESEAFSLMIASNELTDIIEHNWTSALGSPSVAIDDGIILSLNDSIRDYAPNLSAFLSENPDIDKSLKTDDNQYYAFPFIRNDKSLLISSGPIFRADWLEELGLSVPETVEEWENVLTRFRDEKGATAPFTILNWDFRYLLYMLSAHNNYYIDDGKVKFGPAEPEYKEALTILNRWYTTGLLDKNYVSVDIAIQDANILNGKSGATIGSGGGSLGKWLDTMKDKDPSFDLTGARYMGASKEENTRFLPFSAPYASIAAAAITTSCKNVPIAAKFLDYSYGEEGAILNNFGIEGESFSYSGDYPTYSSIITSNTEKLTVSQAMAMYCRANYAGPFIQDKRYIEQYYEKPQQKNALQSWIMGYEESIPYQMPASTTLTPEENGAFINIYNEIVKYKDTMTASFISGTEPLSKYDEYLERMSKLNVEKTIELQQNAYDRYLKR